MGDPRESGSLVGYRILLGVQSVQAAVKSARWQKHAHGESYPASLKSTHRGCTEPNMLYDQRTLPVMESKGQLHSPNNLGN